jgi:hypothetical protein
LVNVTDRLEFAFPVVDDMREYVSSIVEEMAWIFRIPKSDALAIVNEHWASFEIGPDNLLGHEEPEYWARTIFVQYREDPEGSGEYRQVE